MADLPWLTSDLRNDVHDGIDGSISMKFEAFELELFVQSVLMKMWESWTD